MPNWFCFITRVHLSTYRKDFSCCIRFDDLGRDFGSFIIIFYRESAILTCWKLLQIVLVKGRLNSIAAPTPFRYTPSSCRHGSKNKAIQEKWFAPYEYVALEFNSLNMYCVFVWDQYHMKKSFPQLQPNRIDFALDAAKQVHS